MNISMLSVANRNTARMSSVKLMITTEMAETPLCRLMVRNDSLIKYFSC